MPVVPRLTNTQVRTAPLPGVAVRPETFAPLAGAVGEVAQGLGQLAQIQQRERARVDEVRVNESEVELRSRLTGILYDPKKGALFQVGTNAQSQPERVAADVRTAASEIESRLATEEQRLAFRAVRARLEGDAVRQATAHAGQEFARVRDDSYDALTKSELADIAANATDAGWVDRAVSRLRTSTALYGDQAGLAPEQVEQRVEALTSAARVSQVMALVSAGRVEDASATLSQHRESLLGTDRAKADGVVAEAKERITVNGEASRILASAATASEAYELTRGIEDLDRRKAVRAKVEDEFASRERAAKQTAEQVYERAASVVDRNPGRLVREVIDPADWNALSVEQRNALENRATAPQNDDNAWHRFRNLSSGDLAKLSPAEFQTKYWARFDGARRTKAESMFDEARKDPSGSGPAWSSLLTDRERIANALTGFHLVSEQAVADWSAADKELAADFEQEVDAAVREWETQAGKKADPETKQRIITQRAIGRQPLNVRGTLIFKNRELASPLDVETDDRGRVYVPEASIPAAYRTAIQQAAREAGRTVTKRLLEDAYGAVRMNDRARFEALVGGPMKPLYGARP